MGHIKIIVKNGCVNEIYADTDISIDVLDMDTDDADMKENLEAKYEAIINDRSLTMLYG